MVGRSEHKVENGDRVVTSIYRKNRMVMFTQVLTHGVGLSNHGENESIALENPA